MKTELLTDADRTAIINCLESWDMESSNGFSVSETTDGIEIAVPVESRIELDTLLDDQGPLLYLDETREISLLGFEDGDIILVLSFLDE